MVKKVSISLSLESLAQFDFLACIDDCSHCRDKPICNYSRYVDDTYII